MGADAVVNLAAGDELPADVELAFEASGAPAALGAVLHATARGGTVVQLGNLPGTAVPAILGDLVTREITWIGSYRFVDEITDAVAAMANGLDVSPLITHRYPIDQAAEAIAVAADRNSGSSKVLLQLS
jgi:L-idonate 5-dehydrogenase